MPARFAAIEKKLRAACLAYPEAVEEFPWDERVFKVKKKIFTFAHEYQGKLYVTCKLPQSGSMALSFDFAKPTGYGLGKAGWVSATFEPGDDVPVDLLLEWIDESYRAIAPQKLVKTLVKLRAHRARRRVAVRHPRLGLDGRRNQSRPVEDPLRVEVALAPRLPGRPSEVEVGRRSRDPGPPERRDRLARVHGLAGVEALPDAAEVHVPGRGAVGVLDADPAAALAGRRLVDLSDDAVLDGDDRRADRRAEIDAAVAAAAVAPVTPAWPERPVLALGELWARLLRAGDRKDAIGRGLRRLHRLLGRGREAAHQGENPDRDPPHQRGMLTNLAAWVSPVKTGCDGDT